MILVILFILTLIMLLYPLSNMPQQTKDRIQQISEENPNDLAFLEAIYSEVINTFKGEKKCYINNIKKNFIFDMEKLLTYNKTCLPCHQYNKLFQAYVLESGRFDKNQVKSKLTICPRAIMLHIYSEVTLKDGTTINVDTWGGDSEFGVPFGKSIHQTDVCRK